MTTTTNTSATTEAAVTAVTAITNITAEIEGMDTVHRYHEDSNDEQQLTEAEKSMRDEELSFYSNSTNDYGDDNIWGLLSGIGGNIYEWYVSLLSLLNLKMQTMNYLPSDGTFEIYMLYEDEEYL
jgi:hypothetical protein